MIRRHIHARFIAGTDDVERLLRVVLRHREGWTDRLNDWLADRWPEVNPWYVAPLARMVCWYHDWRTTWRLRP